MKRDPLQILFTGYAPVHVVCFLPLYEHLKAMAGADVWFSGGLESKKESGERYDAHALYAHFDLPAQRILTIDQIRERDFDVLFSANSKLIEPRSVEARVQLFHGISFRNRAVREKNMGCDYYFVTGPYMLRKFVEARLFSANDPRALKIGFMKTDRLLNGELNREALLDSYAFDGSRPIILYAPTGARYNSLETMGKEVIAALKASKSFDVLIKPHDHPKDTSTDWNAELAAAEDEHTRLVRGVDVIPPLFLADLLLTDASSVSNEYALLDRPMVFLNVPKLIGKAMAQNDSAVDLDGWGRRAGTIVDKPDRVVATIEDSLANPERRAEIRRTLVCDMFFNSGQATPRALGWMCERFGLKA